MKALNKQARMVSSARISEIANGANLIMGEKEWLANTAIYLANELKTATKAFQSTGFSLLEAEEKLEAAEKRIAEHNFENRLLANADRDIKALRQRIAELEAGTVAVKQFGDFQIVHYGGSEDYAKGYINCQNNYNKALADAGIGVKGE